MSRLNALFLKLFFMFKMEREVGIAPTQVSGRHLTPNDLPPFSTLHYILYHIGQPCVKVNFTFFQSFFVWAEKQASSVSPTPDTYLDAWERKRFRLFSTFFRISPRFWFLAFPLFSIGITIVVFESISRSLLVSDFRFYLL